MKLIEEFRGKSVGDRVRMWGDYGTITEIVSDGWPDGSTYDVAYWVEWDDYAPTCVSFDKDGSWIR